MKIWKDPVWSKVISVGILLILGVTSEHYIGWWNSLKIVIKSSILYLEQTTEINNWLIIVMGISTILILILLLLVIWSLIKESLIDNDSQPWKNYTSDIFWGVECHWKYIGKEGIPYDIYFLCPKCKYQLYPLEYNDYQYFDSITIFSCSNCNTKYEKVLTHPINIKHKVELNVQQKLRTNSWGED